MATLTSDESLLTEAHHCYFSLACHWHVCCLGEALLQAPHDSGDVLLRFVAILQMLVLLKAQLRERFPRNGVFLHVFPRPGLSAVWIGGVWNGHFPGSEKYVSKFRRKRDFHRNFQAPKFET